VASQTLDKNGLRAAVARFSPRSSRWARRCDRAAVALIVRDGALQPELLLVKRARRLGDRWSGHWAFPGGLAQSGDASSLETAVRETREEIGIDFPKCGRLLGRLSDVVTLSHRGASLLVISPFVMELSGDVRLTPGPEVERFHWLPLGDLGAERAGTRRVRRVLGWVWPRWGIVIGRERLWGLSLQMFDELVDVVAKR